MTMVMLNRPGRFRGRTIEAGIAETGPNKLATVTTRVACEEENQNGEWRDVSAEGMEITAYTYLEMKDGNVNDRAIKTLCETFGWDGRDLSFFQNGGLRPCQITAENDTWNGTTKPKVKWINPFDSDGGGAVAKSDDNSLRALQNRLGSKLRAIAPPAPAAAATPPKPSPAPRPAPPPVSAPVVTATADEAWAAIQDACVAANIKADLHEEAWLAAHKACCKTPGQPTPAECGQIRLRAAEFAAGVLPF